MKTAPPVVGDNRPIYSENAEKAVLGLMLAQPVEVFPQLDGLMREDFFVPAHQEVFDALRAVYEKDGGLDIMTVNQWLVDLKRVEAIGGTGGAVGFLAELAASVVSHLNFPAHIAIVRREAARRAAIEEGQALIRQAVESPDSFAPKKAEAFGVRLGDIKAGSVEDGNELIKHRFLCRGGGMLFPGPTGVGKSSWIMQSAILFALGRPCFGMEPAHPLTSVIIQAENDDGDLAEMRDGVLAGLNLTPEETVEALSRIVVHTEDRLSGPEFFGGRVRPLLEKWHPDLLWIDPAFAFLGGEASNAADVGAFLRRGLNPLIHEFQCGAVVAHHTNKPPSGQQKQTWQNGDFAYLGSGSIEWANWARAVITLRTTASPQVFEFRAAKRGGRLRWRDENGEPTTARNVAHSRQDGVICWHEATDADMARIDGGSAKAKSSPEDVAALVSSLQPVSKADLAKAIQSEHGMARSGAYSWIKQAEESRLIRRDSHTKNYVTV